MQKSEKAGERLRILREKKKLKQKDVAQMLGITQQIYSNYETGKCDLPVRHLLGLAEFYDVSTDYILGRISYSRLLPQYSQSFIQRVSIGDFMHRVMSFNSKSKGYLVSYVNYLTYLENSEKKNPLFPSDSFRQNEF